MHDESTHTTHRLLIIDDNRTIHEDFKKILLPAQDDPELGDLAAELFGRHSKPSAHKTFHIDSAYQGQEGLAKVEAAIAEGDPYTVAFVDVRMPPGWDGIETVRRIWEKYPELQVVICTAYSDHSWDDIIEQLGHSDSLVILKKPFDNVEVLQLAHALTKKWSLTRDARNRLIDLDDLVRVRTEALSKANEQLQAEVCHRAKVEAALRASEELFQKAFSAASIPMAILKKEGRVCLEANESFLKLIGRRRDEVVSNPLASLNLLPNPADCDRVLDELNTKGSIRDHRCRIRDKTDVIHEAQISLEPVALGGEDCVLIAMQDVTEQVQLEARLRQSQKMEAVGQLAAGVAHDFNNLLTIIDGHASLQLARSNLDQQIAHALNQVKMAADRAAALTKQLLAFSRKQIVKRKPLNLAAIINRVHPLLARMIGESIALEQSCPHDLPAVFADEHCIEQVIMNLVVNARDATPAGGIVHIHSEVVTLNETEAKKNPDAKAGRFVRLSVVDNGSGIDSAIIPRLFEPFFTTKPKGKGTGLGLSTVYGIVRQHEGWVEVVSHLGHGATFHVYLPISDLPATTLNEVAVTTKPLDKEKKGCTILVVEDEHPLREFMSATLRDHGFNVLQAADGLEAQLVWQAHKEPIAMLLTDMVMPSGISGGELASRLLRRRPDLKVLYTSGYSTEVLENADRLVEGRNFLPKPFNAPKLLNAVQSCLSGEDSIPLSSASFTI